MKISFGGHDIFLHHSGIAILPDSRTAIVADLHLEKGSHFALRGFFLPPYDSEATLGRLLKVLRDYDIGRLVILGDCFHDDKGFTRLQAKARLHFEEILRYDAVWVRGNHDKGFVPPGLQAFDAFRLHGLTLRHEAENEAVFEISGHFHPKVAIDHKGARFQRPCFVEDGNRLLLPSFGAYTGGLDVLSHPIARHFNDAVRYYPLGQSKTYYISAA